MSERDYRSMFLADLGAALAGSMEPDQIQMVTATAVRILQGYEITERCTEFVLVDSPNEQIAKRYLRSRKGTSEAPFLNQKGERIRSGGIRYILNQIAERSGVKDVHPHRFRRTFATSLSNRGTPVQEIQQLMGHSNISTTLQYISINEDRVKASYRKYSA